jgi:hypothetical protein
MQTDLGPTAITPQIEGNVNSPRVLRAASMRLRVERDVGAIKSAAGMWARRATAHAIEIGDVPASIGS